MSKTIKLHDGEIKSKRLFLEVLSLPPQGCNINDMRKRMRIIDAIEKSPDDELVLEDADYDLLKGVFNQNQFRIVHKDILAIADSLA